MTTQTAFKEFYETKLLPDLQALDQERKKVDRKVLIIGAVALVVIIVIRRLFHGSGSG